MSNSDNFGKSRIGRLTEGINEFYSEIKSDQATRYSAEIAIVSFDSEAHKVQDFKLIDSINGTPSFSTGKKGDIGLGVSAALQLLQERKNKYKENGVEYYQPWLIIISDGHSTGENGAIVQQNLESSHKTALELEANKKLTIIPVYCGFSKDGKDDEKAIRELGGYSKNNPVQSINKITFSHFFKWLGKSVSAIPSGEAQDGTADLNELVADWDDI
jgi:uncharacterized protein YegL